MEERWCAVLVLFYKHPRALRPATWATQRPLRWLWEGERSPPASLQEENQRESQIKLCNDTRCTAPLMMLYPILLLVCFIKLTYLSNLFLSGTWGTREKNDLFYLWRLLLLDRRICACSCHLWINLFNRFNRLGSNYIGENPNVRQPSGLKLIRDRLTEVGRAADTRENTWKR